VLDVGRLVSRSEPQLPPARIEADLGRYR
jgi:hypothetical protein